MNTTEKSDCHKKTEGKRTSNWWPNAKKLIRLKVEFRGT